MTLENIKNQLAPGDRSLIADIVGCSVQLVHKIFNGNINHKTYRGERILAVAASLLSYRSELKKQYNVAS